MDFFYYFSDGPTSEIHVYTGHTEGEDFKLEEVQKISGGASKTWRRLRKNVEISEMEFMLVFDGKTKKNNTIVAIDRIFVTKGSCSSVMFCDFENLDLCGYTNLASNDYDWMVGKGNDDSSVWAKPDVDHTLGSENGGFTFVNPGKFDAGMSASLISPAFTHFDTQRCLKFWTHFYGKEIGYLDIFLLHKDYSEVLWHVEDEKMPNEWVQSQVSYIAYDTHHLGFVATTIETYAAGDIALDDLDVINADCEILPDYAGANSNYSNPTTTPSTTTSTTTITTTTIRDETTKTTPTSTTTIELTTTTVTTTTPEPENQYNCDFDRDFCYWKSSPMNEGHDWKLGTGYAYINFRDLQNFHVSNLISYPISASDAVCLKFRYNLYGFSGQLNVKVQDENNSSLVIQFLRAKDDTSDWMTKSVNLHSETNFKIVFEAEQLNELYGYIHIDDIVLEEGECLSNPKSCGFESLSLCGYSYETNNPSWLRGSGMSNTGNGPTDDNGMGTSEGHYMYVDGNFEGEAGSGSVLYSPDLIKESEMCLSVWIHMFGEDVGRLNIYQMQENNEETLKWSRKGSRANMWEHTMFPLEEDFSKYKLNLKQLLVPKVHLILQLMISTH